MRKEDFLEILKDYLKNDFSEDEVIDILRDYEEYFVNGAIEGKSEIEIISSLGSPKEIANELLSESNMENKTTGKVESFFIDTKATFKSWSNKFKVNLNDKNHVQSRRKIEAMQILITIILIPIALSIITSTIAFGISLIASVIGIFIGTPFAISLMKVMPEIRMVVIFGFIAGVGLEILMWQLFILIIKLEKKAFKIYMTWLKTNKLYIDGSIKKEKMDKYDEIIIDKDGGEIDE